MPGLCPEWAWRRSHIGGSMRAVMILPEFSTLQKRVADRTPEAGPLPKSFAHTCFRSRSHPRNVIKLVSHTSVCVQTTRKREENDTEARLVTGLAERPRPGYFQPAGRCAVGGRPVRALAGEVCASRRCCSLW